jgi:hypothetical protein
VYAGFDPQGARAAKETSKLLRIQFEVDMNTPHYDMSKGEH